MHGIRSSAHGRTPYGIRKTMISPSFRYRNRGFTLLELLVVMAITTILLGLIFGPMVQGFNLTNRARVQVLAQDTARQAMEIIQRDTANGVFVFDHHLDINKLGLLADVPNAVTMWVFDKNKNKVPYYIPFGIFDFVPPARVQDQNASVPSGQIDPTTGLAINRGDLSLPLAPGRVIVRYWIGLRNNASMDFPGPPSNLPGAAVTPYNNFYDSNTAVNPLEKIDFTQHNPAIMYRAVFSPYMANLTIGGQVQVDKRLLKVDASGNPILYDSDFFYDNSVAGTVELPGGSVTDKVDGWKDDNGDGKVNVCENWRALARAMIPTDRGDAVTIDRDDNGNTNWDLNTGLPRLIQRVSFQPTYVGNDAGNPASFVDVHNEAPYVAPTSYREAHGAWTLPYRLYMFRSALNVNPLQYFYDSGAGDIRMQQYDTQNNALTQDVTAGFKLDARGQLGNQARPEIMLSTDVRRGLVNCSFPDSLVLHDLNGVPMPSTFDPSRVNTEFDTNYASALNYGASGWPAGREHDIYRMITIAGLFDSATPTIVGLEPGLNPEIPGNAPDGINGPRPPLEQQPDKRSWVPNALIVPGSEVVVGPDMLPGPHYGLPITYTRVPRNTDPKKIGPNEYMINYADVGNMQPVDQNDPPELQQTQKVLQSAGTIIFDSQIDAPDQVKRHAIPYADANGDGKPDVPIVVTYQIQNNKTTDVVKADYLTRELVTVALAVRLYDFNSGQPQQVNLTQKVQVRNLQR